VNVSGTVLDPDGVPYAGATVQSTLISPGGPSPSLTPCNNPQVGCPLAAPWPATTTGPDGSFHFTLYANSSILPASTQWQFTVAQPGINSPWGTGGQTFTYQAAINANVNLSTTLNALAPRLTVPFCNPNISGSCPASSGCAIGALMDTWVLSIHPNATCYGSADFTWDDPNTNLQAGDGFNVITGGDTTQAFILGGSNSATSDGSSTTDAATILGKDNTVSSAAGSLTSNSLIEGRNGLASSTSADSAALYVFTKGFSETATADTGGGLDLVFTNGSTNTAHSGGTDGNTSSLYAESEFSTFSSDASNTSDIFARGEHLSATSSGANSDVDTAIIQGFHLTLSSSGGHTLEDIFQTGDTDAATSSAADSTEVYQIGSNLNCTDCTNVWQFGNNDTQTSVSDRIDIGLSSTAEFAITPGHVSFGGAGTNPSLPLCTDSGNNVSTTGCPSGTPASPNFSTQYNNGGAFGGTSVPATKGTFPIVYNPSTDAAVAPGPLQAGLGGNTISGATSAYTVNFGNNLQVVNHDVAGSAAVTVTLLTPTDYENPSPGFGYENDSAHIDSIVPCTMGAGCAATWTINGAASLSVPPNFSVRIKVDLLNATNWLAASTPLGTVTPIIPTGADPTGATDSYAAIQAAITAAIAQNRELLIPAGTYIVSAGLTAPSNAFRMRGAGANVTSITASTSGYNTLTIGTGTGVVEPSGYVRDIHLLGNSRTSNSGISALQLDGVRQYEVDSVTADTDDIGFDLINNCYGSQFTNIRGGFGGTLNVGVNLRTGAQSGSDISFYNPWVIGQIAGVEMSGGGGGYHFWGGQLGAGEGTAMATDTSGTVILGKDYLTGTTGEFSADFHGTSFEGTDYVWAFRGFDQGSLVTNGIYLNPASSSAPAIGVYKNTNDKNSAINFRGTVISGFWSNASLIVRSGGSPHLQLVESGTYTASSNPTINGTPTFVTSMFLQSGITSANVSIYNNLQSPTLTSTVATGTAPLTVASTTLVANLHAATADALTTAPFYQTVQTAGTPLAQEPVINFPSDMTCTDNPGVATNCTPTNTASTAWSALTPSTNSSAGFFFSANGAASAPVFGLTGAPFTGGSGTTTFPLRYDNCSGATAATNFSTSGTYWGINACSGFIGRLLDLRVNGSSTSSLILDYVGNGTFNGNVFASGSITSKNNYDLGASSHLVISVTAPTVSSGFGTGASITANNGTVAFRLNVGTSNTGSGVIGLPAATTGWNCFATDFTTPGPNNTKESATTTTSATLTNYSATTGLAANWTDSDIVQVSCFAY
jgi:hypothetical protein